MNQTTISFLSDLPNEGEFGLGDGKSLESYTQEEQACFKALGTFVSLGRGNIPYRSEKGELFLKNLETDPDAAQVGPEDKPLEKLLTEISARCEFFVDQFGTPTACFEINQHKELWPLGSLFFRSFVSHVSKELLGGIASGESINRLIQHLVGEAVFNGQVREVHNRIGRCEGALWYDLSSPDWKGVKITAGGWTIEPLPPAFRRYQHQRQQVEPQRGGALADLFKVLPIADKENQLLLGCTLISYFLPDIPRAILVLHGSQGSAKSSSLALIRQLVDPSITPHLSMPRAIPELVLSLSQHYAAFFDNLTGLTQAQSDALSRAITGEGSSKRQLYSDQESVIFSFMRAVALNGINIPAQSPDLLDRCLLIQLERIPKKKRLKKATLDMQFEQMRPFLLGAIFDVLVQLEKLGPVEISELPRMADYCCAGERISRSLGYSENAFYQAYLGSIGRQNTEAIEGSPIGTALLALVAERGSFEMSPAELLDALSERAGEKTVKSKVWPTAANSLTRKLKVLQVNLAEEGITLDFGREKNKDRKRLITVTRQGVGSISSISSIPSEKIKTGLLMQYNEDTDDLAADGMADGSDGMKNDTVHHKVQNIEDTDKKDDMDSSDGIVPTSGVNTGKLDLTMLPTALEAYIRKKGGSKSLDELTLAYNLEPDVVIEALNKGKDAGLLYELPAGTWRSC